MLALLLFSAAVSIVLAAGTALVERFLSNQRYATRWVWLGAMVAMVIASALPFVRATVPAPPPVSPSSTAQGAAPIAPERKAVVHTETATPTAPTATATADPSPSTLPTTLIILSLWLLASMTGLLVLAVSAWRIARMQRAWKPAVIAGVPVMLSHDVGPAIVGLIHHGVVMPKWVEGLPPEQQRLIVTHEREHVRAGDPLLLWGATFLVALFPWNPGMWFALRGLRHAIEIDCDARVLRSQPDTHAYCSLLLDVGERTLAGVAPMAALAEPSTLLERRVDVMTARLSASPGSLLMLAAGVVLLIAGCVAPRTALSPRNDAAALVRELSALLESDSVARSLPRQEREQLAARLTETSSRTTALGSEVIAPTPERTSPPERLDVASDTMDDYGVARRTGTAWEALLNPGIDSTIARRFPQLLTRTDTARKLLLLTYDDRGQQIDADLRDMPDVTKQNTGIRELDVLFYIDRFDQGGEYQWVGHRERPTLHASVLLRVKRGMVRVRSGAARPTMGYGGTVAMGGPPEYQYSRRVDSIARARFHSAFDERHDATVVVAFFHPGGQLARISARRFPLTDVFDSIPHSPTLRMRDAGYIMTQMQMGELPGFAGYGASTPKEAPHAIFIWGALTR